MSITARLLKLVSNDVLANYLMNKGWKENLIERIEVIELVSPDGYYVIVPAVKHLVDYDYTMKNAIDVVSVIDGVGVDDVLEDILPQHVVKRVEMDDLLSRTVLLMNKYNTDTTFRDVVNILESGRLHISIDDVEPPTLKFKTGAQI